MGGVPLKKPTHPFGWLSSRGSMLGRAGGLSRPWGRQGGSVPLPQLSQDPPSTPQHRPAGGTSASRQWTLQAQGEGGRLCPIPEGSRGAGLGFGVLTPPLPPEHPAQCPAWDQLCPLAASPSQLAGATCLPHDVLTGRKGSGSHFNLAI